MYHHSLGILSAREQQFIQTCGKNEDGYLNSWIKIDKSIGDMRKRRGEETKKTMERWHSNKHRVDEAKAQIPERCLSILVPFRLLRIKLAKPPSGRQRHHSEHQPKCLRRSSNATKMPSERMMRTRKTK